ncbi:hypothetical protein [Rhodoblastus sp.]|jgi:uncharacterized membrane protein|uniref:hypothetical protein n=1 Tax=Rhodoblastus sp. TaxID=1962975 RepID=UPI002638A031|nr:hypothetical protein [Rhodoblastus sp.]
MSDFDDLIWARAIHVLAVAHWIGGLAFVTLVILPLARSRPAQEGLALFDAIERRFAAQVRVSIPVAGAAGLWMTYRLDLWSRFLDPHFWWMAAMLGLWAVFTVLVFIIEPLFHARMERLARANPQFALARLTRMHSILLALAVATMAGAVAGAHGFYF